MPPLRNAPSGTSLSSRSWTAVRRVASISSIRSSSTASRCRTPRRPRYCRVSTPAVRRASQCPAAACRHRDRSCRRDEITEREIAFERRQIQVAPSQTATQRERRQLARELKGAIQHRVEERLLSQAIARGEELLPPSVVDRKGEHAFQPIDAGGAEFLVRVQNHFGVGRRTEAMALGLEQRPQPGGCRFRR